MKTNQLTPIEIQKGKFPMRFWVFATFVLLYGVCETVNGNWASLYLTKHFEASTAMASLALTMFWSMVTAGRVLFAGLEKWFPQRLVWRVLPFRRHRSFHHRLPGCRKAIRRSAF